MTLEDFKKAHFRTENDGTGARPRLSEESHKKVQDFTRKSGLNNAKAYNLIIEGALDNEDVLCSILDKQCEDINVEELSDHYMELLDDIVRLTDILGYFPSRREINNDKLCFGFPVYIMQFGSKDNLISAIKEHYPEAYDKIDIE